VLIRFDLHGAIVLIILDVIYHVIGTATLIPGYGRAQPWTLEQMDVGKLFAQFC